MTENYVHTGYGMFEKPNSPVTKERIQEALEEIRRVPLRNYETIRALLEAAAPKHGESE